MCTEDSCLLFEVVENVLSYRFFVFFYQHCPLLGDETLATHRHRMSGSHELWVSVSVSAGGNRCRDNLPMYITVYNILILHVHFKDGRSFGRVSSSPNARPVEIRRFVRRVTNSVYTVRSRQNYNGIV
jgi:hypothetical protein